ncbi:T9SS type A sorting domain-containing protein [Tenacibaculum amylolyticum]|uniref:T9SS type A sorting domain-containing protein n=1 Tax=Tenacibaculum amylolyticum TaxID=104269 RepID=UPI0038960693
MKAIKIACIALSLTGSTLYAQQAIVDCNANLDKALHILKRKEISKKQVEESIQLLKPCAKQENTLSQLLLGRVYVRQKNAVKHKEGFQLIKKAAEKNNPVAMTDLGILYKYGVGCNLSLTKAQEWFEKASALGDNKAMYSLGYLYFKGLENIEQDYKEAVKWFDKSKSEMAKYWLGVCYYYGYGVEKDILKANELLKTNFSLDTTVEDNILTESLPLDVSSTLDQENEIQTIETNTFLGTNTSLNGLWKGQLLLFDWSGKNVEQKTPIQLKINYNTDKDEFSVAWNVDNQKKENQFTQIENTLYYDDLNFVLPHTSFRDGIPNTISHKINSVDFKQKTIGARTFLIATIESNIPDWKETGQPIRMVLQKINTTSSTEDELSDEILKALANQEAHFIKFYPNPFVNDLIVSYSLDKKANTTVTITDLNGNNGLTIKPNGIQELGNYHYTVNGNQFKQGMYLVTILLDGERKTRIIVKK